MPLIKSGSRKALNLSHEDAAYIAGLFDGEGCVNFASIRRSAFIRVYITNTNLDILEYIQSVFGGDIGKLSARKIGWKQGWQWRLSWSNAVEFLSIIEPWLRIKHQQAHVAFAWDAVRLGRGYHKGEKSETYANSLELLRDQLSFLNSKGPISREDPVSMALRETEYHAS